MSNARRKPSTARLTSTTVSHRAPYSPQRFDKLVAFEEQAFKNFGLTATSLCGESLVRLEQYWSDGIWAMAIEKSGIEAKNLYKLANDAGLTK